MMARHGKRLLRQLAEPTTRRGALGAVAADPELVAVGPGVAVAWEATPLAAADWEGVEALARDCERTGGVVGVAVHGVVGELFSRNGERRFRAASTIKVPIMIEAYRQSERGELSLDDRYVLRDENGPLAAASSATSTPASSSPSPTCSR